MTHGMKSREGRRKIIISYQSAIGDTQAKTQAPSASVIEIRTGFAPGHVPLRFYCSTAVLFLDLLARHRSNLRF